MWVLRRFSLPALLTVALCLGVSGCAATPQGSDSFGLGGSSSAQGQTQASSELTVEATAEVTAESTAEDLSYLQDMDIPITIAATGDMLSHGPLTKAATRKDGSNHIKDLMFGVKPYIENADLALCHLEIPFAKSRATISNYPEFAAPPDWIQDIKDLGYDGCSSASNHIWDKRLEGINRTINYMREAHLGQAGTNLSPEQPPYQLYHLQRSGRTIVVAHISLTYGTNHDPIKKIKANPWIANIGDPDRAIAEAKQAREHGAQVVIISMHHGMEYRPQPIPQQLEWAKKFADSGVVDLVLGHHAHVPQPIKSYDRPGKPPMWVYFGVGNMISAQRPNMGVLTQVDEIALPTLHVNGLGQVTRTDPNWVPLVFDRSSFRLYSLDALQRAGNDANIPAPRSSKKVLLSYVNKARKEIGTDGHETDKVPTPSGPEPEIILRDPGAK